MELLRGDGVSNIFLFEIYKDLSEEKKRCKNYMAYVWFFQGEAWSYLVRYTCVSLNKMFKACVIYMHLSAGRSVLSDIQRIVGQADYVPKDPRELASRIFTTCYMGSENSSNETRNRAAQLANQIGRQVGFVCFHMPVCFSYWCFQVGGRVSSLLMWWYQHSLYIFVHLIYCQDVSGEVLAGTKIPGSGEKGGGGGARNYT